MTLNVFIKESCKSFPVNGWPFQHIAMALKLSHQHRRRKNIHFNILDKKRRGMKSKMAESIGEGGLLK